MSNSRKLGIPALVAALGLVLYGLLSMGSTASATETQGEWLTWQVPFDCNPQVIGQTNPAATDCGPIDSIFPQDFVGQGQVEPKCETWVQQDWNKADHPDYGDVLTWGEDHGWATSWRFVYGGPCAVVTPEPSPSPSPEPPVVTPEPTPPVVTEDVSSVTDCTGLTTTTTTTYQNGVAIKVSIDSAMNESLKTCTLVENG